MTSNSVFRVRVLSPSILFSTNVTLHHLPSSSLILSPDSHVTSPTVSGPPPFRMRVDSESPTHSSSWVLFSSLLVVSPSEYTSVSIPSMSFLVVPHVATKEEFLVSFLSVLYFEKSHLFLVYWFLKGPT